MLTAHRFIPRASRTVITDTFNRANATSLGTTSDGNATWTSNVGPWGISSNQACLTSFAGGDLIATVDSGVSDGSVQVTLATVDTSSGSTQGIAFRFVSTTSFLFVARGSGLGSTHYQIWSSSGGTGTLLGTGSVFAASGDVLKLTFSGSSISLYVNGVLDASGTSSQNLTATKHGLYGSGTTVGRWDDLLITVP